MFVTRGTKYQFICPSLRIPASFPSDFGQINLALEDLIPTCAPRNLTESAESGGFRKVRPVRNRKKFGMHNLALEMTSNVTHHSYGCKPCSPNSGVDF